MLSPPARFSLPRLALILAILPGCLAYPDAGSADSGLAPDGLDDGAVIEGTVTDASGGALVGAYVTTVPRGYETTTGDDGTFRIPLLPTDTYQVVVAADGMLAGTSDAVTVADGETATLDVVLQDAPAGGVLRVRLLGPDDLPLADAPVVLSNGFSGTTDAEGELELTGVAGDELTLTLGDAATHWPREIEGLTIVDAGGERVAVQLSGRPPDGSTYYGSSYCLLCHTDRDGHEYTKHADALSTELDAEVLARFTTGETIDIDGASAVLSVDGDTPTVTLVDTTGASRSYAVEGLIASASSRAVPWVEDGEQAYPLPFAWVAEDPERGPDYPDGQARWVRYQVDRWLDGDGELVALDPATSAEANCFPCHATGFELSPRADGGVDMVAANGSGRWNEAGVQCESCHGPGTGHAATGADERVYTITRPGLLATDRANEVCGQCHSNHEGVGTGRPYPLSDAGYFQPGMRLADFATPADERWANGTSSHGRQQYDDLLLSPHGDEGGLRMRCTDCHAPHGYGDDGVVHPHQGRLNPDDNSLCLSCHLDQTFGGDDTQVVSHVDHPRFDPESDHQTGRCATCHMPATAATTSFSTLSGAGDASSHLFTVVPPQDTVDAFDDAGTSTLPVGSFPTHSCAECHAYASWWWDDVTPMPFPGPWGDVTQRSTHEAFQDAYAEKYE